MEQNEGYQTDEDTGSDKDYSDYYTDNNLINEKKGSHLINQQMVKIPKFRHNFKKFQRERKSGKFKENSKKMFKRTLKKLERNEYFYYSGYSSFKDFFTTTTKIEKFWDFKNLFIYTTPDNRKEIYLSVFKISEIESKDDYINFENSLVEIFILDLYEEEEDIDFDIDDLAFHFQKLEDGSVLLFWFQKSTLVLIDQISWMDEYGLVVDEVYYQKKKENFIEEEFEKNNVKGKLKGEMFLSWETFERKLVLEMIQFEEKTPTMKFFILKNFKNNLFVLETYELCIDELIFQLSKIKYFTKKPDTKNLGIFCQEDSTVLAQKKDKIVSITILKTQLLFSLEFDIFEFGKKIEKEKMTKEEKRAAKKLRKKLYKGKSDFNFETEKFEILFVKYSDKYSHLNGDLWVFVKQEDTIQLYFKKKILKEKNKKILAYSTENIFEKIKKINFFQNDDISVSMKFQEKSGMKIIEFRRYKNYRKPEPNFILSLDTQATIFSGSLTDQKNPFRDLKTSFKIFNKNENFFSFFNLDKFAKNTRMMDYLKIGKARQTEEAKKKIFKDRFSPFTLVRSDINNVCITAYRKTALYVWFFEYPKNSKIIYNYYFNPRSSTTWKKKMYYSQPKKKKGFENFLKDVKNYSEKSTGYQFYGVTFTGKEIVELKISDFGICFFCLTQDFEIDVYRRKRIRRNYSRVLEFVTRIEIPGLVSFNINSHSSEFFTNSIFQEKTNDGNFEVRSVVQKIAITGVYDYEEDEIDLDLENVEINRFILVERTEEYKEETDVFETSSTHSSNFMNRDPTHQYLINWRREESSSLGIRESTYIYRLIDQRRATDVVYHIQNTNLVSDEISSFNFRFVDLKNNSAKKAYFKNNVNQNLKNEVIYSKKKEEFLKLNKSVYNPIQVEFGKKGYAEKGFLTLGESDDFENMSYSEYIFQEFSSYPEILLNPFKTQKIIEEAFYCENQGEINPKKFRSYFNSKSIFECKPADLKMKRTVICKGDTVVFQLPYTPELKVDCIPYGASSGNFYQGIFLLNHIFSLLRNYYDEKLSFEDFIQYYHYSVLNMKNLCDSETADERNLMFINEVFDVKKFIFDEIFLDATLLKRDFSLASEAISSTMNFYRENNLFVFLKNISQDQREGIQELKQAFFDQPKNWNPNLRRKLLTQKILKKFRKSEIKKLENLVNQNFSSMFSTKYFFVGEDDSGDLKKRVTLEKLDIERKKTIKNYIKERMRYNEFKCQEIHLKKNEEIDFDEMILGKKTKAEIDSYLEKINEQKASYFVVFTNHLEVKLNITHNPKSMMNVYIKESFDLFFNRQAGVDETEKVLRNEFLSDYVMKTLIRKNFHILVKIILVKLLNMVVLMCYLYSLYRGHSNKFVNHIAPILGIVTYNLDYPDFFRFKLKKLFMIPLYISTYYLELFFWLVIMLSFEEKSLQYLMDGNELEFLSPDPSTKNCPLDLVKILKANQCDYQGLNGRIEDFQLRIIIQRYSVPIYFFLVYYRILALVPFLPGFRKITRLLMEIPISEIILRGFVTSLLFSIIFFIIDNIEQLLGGLFAYAFGKIILVFVVVVMFFVSLKFGMAISHEGRFDNLIAVNSYYGCFSRVFARYLVSVKESTLWCFEKDDDGDEESDIIVNYAFELGIEN